MSPSLYLLRIGKNFKAELQGRTSATHHPKNIHIDGMLGVNQSWPGMSLASNFDAS